MEIRKKQARRFCMKIPGKREFSGNEKFILYSAEAQFCNEISSPVLL
jgi:hypothetical protein